MAILVLSMTGVLFTLPQYFQGVLGTDAMGSGLRLLPLVGGLIVGAVPADRSRGRSGRSSPLRWGSGCSPAACCLAARPARRGRRLHRRWVALVGLGMGITFATSASRALGACGRSRRSGARPSCRPSRRSEDPSERQCWAASEFDLPQPPGRRPAGGGGKCCAREPLRRDRGGPPAPLAEVVAWYATPL